MGTVHTKDAGASELVEGSEGVPLDALVGGCDWSERVQPELQVKGAAAQVVHDANCVPARRQMQRGCPSAVAIPT